MKFQLLRLDVDSSCLSDMSMVMIYMAVIGVVGVMTFSMFAVCFLLRRPGKMPAVLVSQLGDFGNIKCSFIKTKSVRASQFQDLKKRE